MNTVLRENVATIDGGAVNSLNSRSCILRHCRILQNSCGGRGGGIFLDLSTGTVDGKWGNSSVHDTVFEENEAKDGSALYILVGNIHL